MVVLHNITELEIEQTFAWLQTSALRELFMMKSLPSIEQHRDYFKKVLLDNSQKVFAIYIYIR